MELGGGYLDSTELLTEGASHWVEAGALPSARSRMAAVSLPRKIILTGTAVFTFYSYINNFQHCTGGSDAGQDYLNVILQWNTATEEWTGAGTMSEGRHSHSMSVIDPVLCGTTIQSPGYPDNYPHNQHQVPLIAF